MKIRNITPLLLVSLLVFAGCSKPEDPKLTHEYIYYNDGREEQVENATIDASTKN